MVNQYEKKNKINFYTNTDKKTGDRTKRFHKSNNWFDFLKISHTNLIAIEQIFFDSLHKVENGIELTGGSSVGSILQTRNRWENAFMIESIQFITKAPIVKIVCMYADGGGTSHPSLFL